MQNIYCDMCKKEIKEPVTGRNLFYVREYTLCESCKGAVDAKLRPIVLGHNPYSADWYMQESVSLIEKGSSSARR